jgi:hypothetical protein
MSDSLPPADDNAPDSLYKDRWTVGADVPADGLDDRLLPPVQPPSAGFIVQLFVVPAVIVTVIIGVYLLFGQLASGEADWRQLVTNVGSENAHVRWRSALDLAQVLQDDALRKDKGQHLASSPEVAQALTVVLADLLKKTNLTEEEAQQTDYMLKAVGLLDIPETAVPVLLTATEGTRDGKIRKTALNSLAMICGRAFVERQKPVEMPTLTTRIIEVSQESELLSRHQATYILGTLTSPEARERLGALLEDPDQMTQLNAAVGFARQNSTQGLPVIERLFVEAAHWTLDPSAVTNDEEGKQHFERVLLITNGMLAVQNLAPQLDAVTRERLRGQIAKCAERATDIAVQKQWVSTKAALSQ